MNDEGCRFNGHSGRLHTHTPACTHHTAPPAPTPPLPPPRFPHPHPHPHPTPPTPPHHLPLPPPQRGTFTCRLAFCAPWLAPHPPHPSCYLLPSSHPVSIAWLTHLLHTTLHPPPPHTPTPHHAHPPLHTPHAASPAGHFRCAAPLGRCDVRRTRGAGHRAALDKLCRLGHTFDVWALRAAYSVNTDLAAHTIFSGFTTYLTDQQRLATHLVALRVPGRPFSRDILRREQLFAYACSLRRAPLTRDAARINLHLTPSLAHIAAIAFLL